MNEASKNRNKEDLLSRLDRLTIVRVTRDGLVHIIPVLILGAFALIIKTFPIEAYQDFIETFAGGFIFKLAEVVYSATFGVLSVYMTYSISRSYMRNHSDFEASQGGAIIASLIFGLANTLIILIFDTDSARELLITAANNLFSFGEVGFFKGFFPSLRHHLYVIQ